MFVKKIMDNIKINADITSFNITIGSCDIKYDMNNKCEIMCPCVNITVDKNIEVEIETKNINNCKKSFSDRHLILNDKSGNYYTYIDILHDVHGGPNEVKLWSNGGANKYSCHYSESDKKYLHYYQYNEPYRATNSNINLYEFLKKTHEEKNFERFLRDKYKT